MASVLYCAFKCCQVKSFNFATINIACQSILHFCILQLRIRSKIQCASKSRVQLWELAEFVDRDEWKRFCLWIRSCKMQKYNTDETSYSLYWQSWTWQFLLDNLWVSFSNIITWRHQHCFQTRKLVCTVTCGQQPLKLRSAFGNADINADLQSDICRFWSKKVWNSIWHFFRKWNFHMRNFVDDVLLCFDNFKYVVLCNSSLTSIIKLVTLKKWLTCLRTSNSTFLVVIVFV